MARSKMIIDFINGEKSLTAILQELMVIVNEFENDGLDQWIKSELKGYESEQTLPGYRRNLPYQIKYSGINRRLKMTNQPLPIQAFGEYAKDIADLNEITSSIMELEALGESNMIKDLTSLAGVVQHNTGISCYSISFQFGLNVPDIIITNVKTRVIEALLLLEKEFGNLDDLFIDTDNIGSKKINNIIEEIEIIIYSDGGVY